MQGQDNQSDVGRTSYKDIRVTELQQLRARALAQCTMMPGSWEKRFARDMASIAAARPESNLSPKQMEWITKLSWRFRRQMPQHLVPAQDPGEIFDQPNGATYTDESRSVTQ